MLAAMDRDLADAFPMDAAGGDRAAASSCGLLVAAPQRPLQLPQRDAARGGGQRRDRRAGHRASTGRRWPTTGRRRCPRPIRTAPAGLARGPGRRARRRRPPPTCCWPRRRASGTTTWRRTCCTPSALAQLRPGRRGPPAAGAARAGGSCATGWAATTARWRTWRQARELAVRGGRRHDPGRRHAGRVDGARLAVRVARVRATWPSGRASWPARPERRPALQARVLLALGRSLHRFNQDREAAELLRQAAAWPSSWATRATRCRSPPACCSGSCCRSWACWTRPRSGWSSVGRAVPRPRATSSTWPRCGTTAPASGSPATIGRASWRTTTGCCAYARRMGSANLERNANINSAMLPVLAGRVRGGRAVRPPDHRDRRALLPPGRLPPRRRPCCWPASCWCQGDEAEAPASWSTRCAPTRPPRAREAQNELLLLPNDEMLLDMIALVMAPPARPRGSRWSPGPAPCRRARS